MEEAKIGNKPTDKTNTKTVLIASTVKIKKDKPVITPAAKIEKENPEGTNETLQVAVEFPKPTGSGNAALALADTKTDALAGVVHVLVKRDNLEEMATDNEENNLRENLARKGALLKNIYKQARNFKNGEPVELATLGVNTERIQSESKSIKEKFNKVISL